MSAVNWAKSLQIEALLCSLPPLALSNVQNVRGVNPLVIAGWRDVSTHTLIASLSKSESDLWSELAHDARQQIRAAQSAGYEVIRADWREMLEDYYSVHVKTYRRTGVTPHPKAYFELIAETARRGNAVLWVGRAPDGRPVAFHNCARYRDGSVYNTGCCETDHLRSGVNYLLFWNAIKGAKDDGCKWYEIGEVFPDLKEGKLRGLTIFKEKFGGELYRIYKGEVSLTQVQASKYLRPTARMMPFPMRRFARRQIERLLGRAS